MRQSHLVYCECGTPLLREVHWLITADAWVKAYESNNLNATIELETLYSHYRWHPQLLRESGAYEVLEDEAIEYCPACERVLETKEK